MKKIFNKQWPLLLLLALALLTRFWRLESPPEVVFDEVHFGKFVSAYFTHEYYFDIHPPLGKLMIAGTANLLGYNPGFDFKQIGEALDVRYLFALRFLTALFGVLLIIIIYQLLLALDLSRLGAFAGAFMVLFDNAVLVESKFILVDIFLLCFGFASLYFFIKFQKTIGKWKIINFIITAILLGLAYSIKSTGVSFLGIVLLFTLINFFRDLEFKKFALTSLGFIIVSFVIYISIFPIHFALLNKSGPGDAYMSGAFQKTLEGNKVNPSDTSVPLGFWGKFSELNQAMFNYSAGLKATHPDGSKWYEWPLMRKPIYYWVKSGDDVKASIYLIGNPLVWWPSFLAAILSVVLLFYKKVRRKLVPGIYFLLAGYFLNLLPFIFITRVAFLYHYLISLIFSIIILVFLGERLVFQKEKIAGHEKTYLTFYFIGLGMVLISFLIISPLTYGLTITAKQAEYFDSFIKFLH